MKQHYTAPINAKKLPFATNLLRDFHITAMLYTGTAVYVCI